MHERKVDAGPSLSARRPRTGPATGREIRMLHQRKTFVPSDAPCVWRAPLSCSRSPVTNHDATDPNHPGERLIPVALLPSRCTWTTFLLPSVGCKRDHRQSSCKPGCVGQDSVQLANVRGCNLPNWNIWGRTSVSSRALPSGQGVDSSTTACYRRCIPVALRRPGVAFNAASRPFKPGSTARTEDRGSDDERLRK